MYNYVRLDLGMVNNKCLRTKMLTFYTRHSKTLSALLNYLYTIT